MADGFGLRNKLDARIAAARRSLFWPALVQAALPAIIWFTIFAVFWLTGLYTAMPPEWQATTGVVFWVGFITVVLIGLKVWRRPTEDEARDLIDNAIEGRPLSVWNDRPAKADKLGMTLWREHRDRMAALAAKAGKLDVRSHWRQADPFYLRFAAPVVLVVAGAVAGTAVLDRTGKGLFPDFGALFGAHTLKTEAWVTPPAYTGSAPFVLTPGQMAKAPEGSEVTIRIVGPGRPQVGVMPDGGAHATLNPEPGIDGAYEARVVIKQGTRIAVNFWGERASFPFTIIDDATPTVAFVEPPKLGDGDRTEFKYTLGDDYGVEKLELIAVRTDTPKSAGVVEDATIIETVTLAPTEEEGEFSQDLVRHRWAGLDMMVKLRVTDAAGQTAESEAVAYSLPKKIFLQPIARMAQESRELLLRNWEEYSTPEGADNFTSVAGAGYDAFAVAPASRLTWAPEGIKRSVMVLDAMTWRPDDYFEDPVIYMGLRNARGLIDAAHDRAEAEEAEDLLWNIALQAEYGSVADAAAALEAARRALEEALRRGASEEEIRRLMDMYEQAIEDYLAAQIAEAMREGRVNEGGQQQGGMSGGPQQLGDDELTRMLQALRDLAETGARDQARQLLNDMQNMLDQMQNMQIQMGQGGSGQPQDGPMSRAMNRALQDTNRALNDQRDLNDATEEAMREGDAQRGQELADQQRQQRERLEQQQRSGGGQPQRPGQQQGQQGQQGQGQQGQGQQPGQGQQGQGPGEGQQGQGQGNQPGQQQGQGQGQRDGNGPGGQPGRPGVRGDGIYGQENDRSRRLLGNAIEMQRRAEEALRRGDFQAAREAQQQAMAALQDRSSELARINDENDPDAQAERDERDILGRLSDGTSGQGEDVEIPDEIERQRAREILDEIRRRAGDRALTKEDLEYLERLLERF